MTANEKLMSKYKSHPQDTGSTEVQIIILSEKISELSKHLREHTKDFDSRVGLLKLIGKRRRLLNYLATSGPENYKKIIVDLKLKR